MGRAVEIQQDNAPALTGLITPAAMIQHAIANGSGIEVMEKLLAMQERYDAMQGRKSFDTAMALLRKDMPTVIKNQSAAFGEGKASYQYEDLSAVTEALSPIMAEVGLSFRWRTASNANGVSVTCIISHRGGHSEETTLAAGFDTSGKKNPIQALGSAVTYLQRYTLKAAVGIAAAKDDDGGSADDRHDEPRTRLPTRPAHERHLEMIGNAHSIPELRGAWDAAAVEWDDMAPEHQAALVKARDAKRIELSKPKQTTTTATDDPFGFDRMEREGA